MQSEYRRSHLLKAYARQCANTVGIQAESTNREIDYDVMNDIVPIVIWHYCRNAVGRLHSDSKGWRGCSRYLYVELLFSKVSTVAFLSECSRQDCIPTS
jgi:hypothetical protein